MGDVCSFCGYVYDKLFSIGKSEILGKVAEILKTSYCAVCNCVVCLSLISPRLTKLEQGEHM